MQLVTLGLLTAQWAGLLRTVAPQPVRTHQVFLMNLKGIVAEALTPGSKIGGESIRLLQFSRLLEGSSARAGSVILVQKGISMSAFTLLCLGSMVWMTVSVSSGYGGTEGAYVVAFLLLLTLTCILAALAARPALASVLLQRLPWSEDRKKRVSRATGRFVATVAHMATQKRHLAGQFFLSLLIWGFFGVKSQLILYSLGISLSFGTVAAITYITYMVSMIPLAPGGLGTFEGSMVALLLPLGVLMHAALTAALVIRFVTFWFVVVFSLLVLGLCKAGRLVLYHVAWIPKETIV